MNLIDDRWIPIRRADGSTDKIAPWEITQDIHDEKRKIIAVASPRPDFDGALTQFLIGLLQTACTPETEDAWWEWLETPPISEQLQNRINPFAASFDLGRDVPRFMQDYKHTELTETLEIAALFIEAPGAKALKENKDHFIKRDTIKQLCPECVSAALFTIQLNAPSGGQGHRTGLRGGGPLTTLVIGESLWESCWLNVLIKSNYMGENIMLGKDETDKRFPWLSSTHTGKDTYPSDIHPDQQFWAMPRRMFLIEENLSKPEACNLCGQETVQIYKQFRTKNYGINYMGAYEHPLSPHYIKDNAPNPVHPQPGGFGYRHWLGFVENSQEGNSEKRPARVINQFRSLSRKDGNLWAFGYDMDNMKARSWYDSRMPILIIVAEHKETFRGYVEQLIQSANWIADNLSKKLKKAVFGETEMRGNFAFIKALFWHQTENIFYQTMYQLRDALLINQSVSEIKLSWRSKLSQDALVIFDEKSQTGDFDAVDPRRVASARNELYSILYGNKLKEILGFPKEKTKKKKR
ncbi:MAG TPA: type I-E CRISPR-associated protein Cse1/CasA [Desulfatiglandales bacterium]|nr:type I-E CRISPR-associated protein Cse1/CasA [Desulfatiglandales bacterium]